MSGREYNLSSSGATLLFCAYSVNQKRTLGHYRLDGRLGEGGMGEVFRAYDTRLNRPVAVKVMRQAGDGRIVSAERFMREARAASALNHPNIVIIHEVGETPEGDPYF